MEWWRILLFAVVRIVSMIIAGVGFALDYTGEGILTLSSGWGRIALIALTVLVLLTILREVDLAFQQKPKITFSPIFINNCAILEVENKGATTVLSIRGRLKQGDLQTNIYDIYIGDINKDDKKSIRIAEIKDLNFFDGWQGFSEMTDVDKHISDLMWSFFYDKKTLEQRYPTMEHSTEEIIIEIILTTDKPMTKKIGTHEYLLKCDLKDGLTFAPRE